MKIKELLGRFPPEDGVDARFVRYLTTQEIISPPEGGRSNATYKEEHVTRIKRYLYLRECGFAVWAIRQIFDGDFKEAIPFEVAPGIMLTVTPAALGDDLDVDDVAAKVAKIIRDTAGNLTAGNNEQLERNRDAQ